MLHQTLLPQLQVEIRKSTLPEVINFYHTGRGLHLSKFVKFMPNKWEKDRLYPSLPVENKNNDSEERLEKQLKD